MVDPVSKDAFLLVLRYPGFVVGELINSQLHSKSSKSQLLFLPGFWDQVGDTKSLSQKRKNWMEEMHTRPANSRPGLPAFHLRGNSFQPVSMPSW